MVPKYALQTANTMKTLLPSTPGDFSTRSAGGGSSRSQRKECVSAVEAAAATAGVVCCWQHEATSGWVMVPTIASHAEERDGPPSAASRQVSGRQAAENTITDALRRMETVATTAGARVGRQEDAVPTSGRCRSFGGVETAAINNATHSRRARPLQHLDGRLGLEVRTWAGHWKGWVWEKCGVVVHLCPFNI